MAGRERRPRLCGGRLEDRGRRGALRPDPRLVPACRPAALALRARVALAARRGLHRTAPAGHACPCIPRARGRGVGRAPVRASRRAAARQADLPRRSERHGHRERRHGGRPRRRPDRARQCGVRASRPGSLPVPRLVGRPDRRDRLERSQDRRGRQALGVRAPARVGAHRGGKLHRARSRYGRRRHRRGRRTGRLHRDPPRVRAARDSTSSSGRPASGSRRGRSS